ncbi:hypothetical protein [uncultured Psychrobacter sp.]|uniref:hypothetical protein n=1 Tax=uncultured Psychrobacter sp. TaxID=259303 RepID=UPI003458C96D
MIRSKKQWSSALLFSIAIHVVIFLVLYINFSQTDTTKDSNPYNNERMVHEARDEQLPLKTTSTDAPFETNTSNVMASTVIVEDEQKLLLQTEQTNGLSTLHNKKELEPKESSKSLREDMLETHTNIVDMVVYEQNLEPLLQDENTIDYDENIPFIATANDAGLLSIDIPTVIGETEVNESQNLLKGEIEEVNTQLSAAINEIKERNQQKINQQRQQQTYTYISEDYFSE